MRRLAAALCLLAASVSAQTREQRDFRFGFEQRVRNENWNNLFDFNDTMDDERVQIRYRTRLWMDAPLTSKIDFHIGLNQETNEIVRPHSPVKFDEVMFETAYVDIKRLFVNGLSLKVGRQNLIKGEGFLILEGNPWDGSRSIFFNAAVLGYAWKKSKIEFIGIVNPREERYLPMPNRRYRRLNDWNEQAVGAYYTDGNLKNTTLEAYYFYKKETGDPRSPRHAQFQADRHIHTAGGRAVQKLADGWSLNGEMALQWGAQRPDIGIAGWGGYAYAKKTFSGGRHYLLGGYWGMSGDNPATRTIENWDPLFSRWPKWSEMYIYSQFREVAPAYWTNTGIWQAELGYSPWKRVLGRLTYYRMDAFHPFRGDPRTFGSGTFRGHHPQAKVDVNVNKHWKGHVLYEYLAPGSFYSYRSHSYFLRFEVIYTYESSMKF